MANVHFYKIAFSLAYGMQLIKYCASAIAEDEGADHSRRGGARAAALCVGAAEPLTSRCATFAIYPAVTSSPSRNLIAPN